MKFRCDTCGQRYVSNDEPEPRQSYRLPCLVCGGTVLLRGGDFPALPTIPEPDAPGPGSTPNAVGEEPLGLALAPFARNPERAAARQRAPPEVPGRRPARGGRWPGFAAAAGVAMVSAAILALALFRDTDSGPPPTRGTTRTAPAPELPGWASTAPVCEPAEPSASVAPGPPEQKLARSPRPVPPVSERRTGAPRAAAPAPAGPSAEPVARAPQEPSAASRLPAAEEIAAAVAADRTAFDACVQESLREEPELAIAGRQIDLLMTVNPTGIVTSSEIDDPDFQDTALSRCLRSTARGLVLPQFEGEPFQVRIPLRIGAGKSSPDRDHVSASP